VTLADIGKSVLTLWCYCSQTFKLFSFPIYRCWAYLVMVIPETRRVH